MGRVSENLYFALTEQEKASRVVDYPLTNGFTHKAVHTSLASLKEFLKEEFPNSYGDFYYTILDRSDFDIDTNVVSELKETVSIALPLSFSIKSKAVLKVFNK